MTRRQSEGSIAFFLRNKVNRNAPLVCLFGFFFPVVFSLHTLCMHILLLLFVVVIVNTNQIDMNCYLIR